MKKLGWGGVSSSARSSRRGGKTRKEEGVSNCRRRIVGKRYAEKGEENPGKNLSQIAMSMTGQRRQAGLKKLDFETENVRLQKNEGEVIGLKARWHSRTLAYLKQIGKKALFAKGAVRLRKTRVKKKT